MKKNITIYCLLALATVLGLGACSEENSSLPDGMGQVEIHLTSRYHQVTRATGDWLDPISDQEMIKEYWVAFVNSNNIVEELVNESLTTPQEEHTFRFLLPPGNYTAYAFANLPESTPFSSLGIKKGDPMPDLTNVKLATTNGWTDYIPMTCHTGGQAITVIEQENQTFQIELIRTMAKLEFTFINDSQQQMDIVGYEIYPLTTTNVSLLEPENPESIVTSDSMSYKVELATPQVLAGKVDGADPAKWTTFIYVNETNATATATHNQYSIRILVQRHRTDGATNEEMTVDEMRYGFTVNGETTGPGYDPTKENYQGENTNGFNYIRRNDWIKLPIMFTDWTFRIEALPFPPIAGFQARVLSADALSITFNSGGYIFLRPMFRNNHDPEGVWRGFDDEDVTFVLRGEPYIVNGTPAVYYKDEPDYDPTAPDPPYQWTTPFPPGVAESIDSETNTGVIITGDLGIMEQRFVQLASGDIVGKLTNTKTSLVTDPSKPVGMITVTIKLKLDGFAYQFNYNIYEDND